MKSILISSFIVLVGFVLILAANLTQSNDQKLSDNQKISNIVNRMNRYSLLLPDKCCTIKVKRGISFAYSHPIYLSVGNDYEVEYDNEAFVKDEVVKYDHPEMIENGACGADSAVMTTIFRALKDGKFTIKIIHKFRGEVEKVLTYMVIVENR